MPDELLLESGEETDLEDDDQLLLESIAAGAAIRIREKPPLRLDYDIETPSGRHYHWSDQEPHPGNIPSGFRCSSTMPGGFESADIRLPRKRRVIYSDLDRLSTFTAYGPGGDIVWEGRLERAAKSSGDELSVSPGLVGWQAHLEDDQNALMVYRHINLADWRGASVQERLDNLADGYSTHDGEVQPDLDTGEPALALIANEPWASTSPPDAEAWFDAGAGGRIGSVYYAWKKSSTLDHGSANWDWKVILSDIDHWSGASEDKTSNLRAAGPGSGTLTATTNNKRYAWVELDYAKVASGSANEQDTVWWTTLAVYGDHGLTVRGTEPAAGFYASDVVGHAVGEWCPLLTADVSGSTFIIPHLAFTERTTAGEIVRQATRFGLQDWAVWDNRTFFWHDRGQRGRSWRARVAAAKLEETGASAERLFNGVVVEYRDVDGSTRTVGPTGSGADTEDSSLLDSDPENPANELGIVRYRRLQMGVSTSAGAVEVGRRFLEETKALDSSGKATLAGHVMDDKGVLHPAWRVRAGDTIAFVDASDTSARRIVRADYDHPSRTCSVDIDAPPESMEALLERLSVVLIPLGL